MSDALDLVWQRADVRNHVLEHGELTRFQPTEREAILHLRLIRRTSDARTVLCEDCGEPHLAEVIHEPCRPVSPYYLCPMIGRIPVRSETLQRWEVDFDRLSALIRQGTRLGGKPNMLIRSRIWLLGRKQQAVSFWELFLMRGLCWPDGIRLLDHCLRLQQSPAPVIVVPKRLPSVEALGTRRWAIRSLSEIANVEGSKLVVDFDVLSNEATTAQFGAASTRPHSTAKRLPRSIGTPEAVNAALEYMESKGLNETQFGNQFESTDRTVRNFLKTGKIRRSTFEVMAESMGLSIEQLLRGELPPPVNRSHRH